MINFNTVNKANTAQSLLPDFTETADISGDSFQSIFNSFKENSSDFSNSIYSKKENSFSSYREKNSYSTYSDKNNYNEYRNEEKKYSKNNDKENYTAIERKEFRDDSPSSRNIKDTNTVKEQNVFEKKDIKSINSSKTSNNTENSANNIHQSNQNNMQEDSQDNTVSIKDILALLQTAAKVSNADISNDDNVVEDIKNIDLQAVLQDMDSTLSKLNISDDLKTQLRNIISSLENMSQSDLEQFAAYISVLSDDFNLSNINEENISLEEISDKILGNEKDKESLEKAYTVLEEKISQLNINENSKENIDADINKLKTNILSSRVKSEDNNISKIIDNISSLIDEAVNQSDLSDNSETLRLAKDILQAVQNAAKNMIMQPNQVEQQVVQSGSEVLDETVIINNKLSDDTILNIEAKLQETAELLTDTVNSNKANKTEVKQQETHSNIDTESLQETAELLTDTVNSNKANKTEVKQQETHSNIDSNKANKTEVKQQETHSNIDTESLQESAELLTDTAVSDDIIAENKSVKENIKDVLKETIKDTVKQSDTVSVKDIQKEFKTANVEVTESLRGESAAKADIKANTVTFNETGKNLQNNLNQKEMMTGQNSAEENFSTSQSDKGNNFNYFLKSSAEAQAKYETLQSKEAQAPYNMKEPRDIERLVRTMQSSVNKGESKLTVVLTPENLGKLQIQLTESGGKVTAKFLSDNENSHKIIMAQSDLLKNQLSEKGIVIDNMEFAFNDAMSKQQTGEEHGRRASKQSQRNKGLKNQEEDLEVGTQVANNKSTGIYA